MAVKVGSARSSYGNTTPGDQKGGAEVSTQNYYVHSKGWRVFRAIDVAVRAKLADAMSKACKNDQIGYDQATRLTLTNNVKDFGYDPSKTTKPVNTDCSALVRCCCLYAGIKVDNFTTPYEPTKLLATGAFKELVGDKYTKSSDYLSAGDILVTKTQGHTVIVLTSGPKCEDNIFETTLSPVYDFGDRTLVNGLEGDDVKTLQSYLIQLGYNCGSWGADGDFGDCTEMAVKTFQSENRLEVDGKVGPKTAAKLIELLQDTVETSTTVHIVGGNCYIRMIPSVDGTILGVAYAGTTYIYANETSDSGWIKVLISNATGWVSGKYAKRA